MKKLIWSRGKLGRPIANLAVMIIAFVVFTFGEILNSTKFVSGGEVNPDYLTYTSDIIPNVNTATTLVPESRKRTEPFDHIVAPGDTLSSIGERYKISIDAIKYIQKGFKFNISSIKKLYYIITKDLIMQNGGPYPRGFKSVNNVVNNMETVPHDKVIPKLNDLLEYYKKNKLLIHPLKLAMDFHLTYEHIHPFLDGNGRTGRMILNLMLLRNNFPPLIIKNKNRKEYYRVLSVGHKADLTKIQPAHYQEIVMFCYQQLLETYDKIFSKWG